jgi:transcriptional regulator with XRE-family HTH domain
MDWKYVSKQVKLARTRRNMTQDDLAAATSKHRATIARLETGNPINQGTLYAIADALKVEYSVLTGETGSLGGPPGLLDEIAPDQEDAMEHLLSQSRDLANLIVGWEVLTANEITLGQLAKAIDYSHRLKDTVDALDALGITEKKDLPPLGPPNGDPNRSPPSNTARGD